jgi:XrtJ-associated TM-motif-TM protein
LTFADWSTSAWSSRLHLLIASTSRTQLQRIQHIEHQFEDTMNLKKTALAFAFALLLAAALPLHAQTGCDDSPEDPTIVLALLGGAGALITSLRARRRRI